MNIPIILDEGAQIFAWDPIGVKNYRKYYPDEITYCDTIEEALQDADICFIFTEWKDICRMDVKEYRRLMKKPIVLDGRNCYELEQFKGTGITYDSIGRKVVR